MDIYCRTRMGDLGWRGEVRRLCFKIALFWENNKGRGGLGSVPRTVRRSFVLDFFGGENRRTEEEKED